MVICVKCVDGIERNRAIDAGWKRVDGGWHCPKCLVGVSPELIAKDEDKRVKRDMMKKEKRNGEKRNGEKRNGEKRNGEKRNRGKE